MTRPPFPRTYTFDDLLSWMRAQATAPGVWRCLYCHRALVLEEVELDHKEALERGGSAELENRCCSCKLCNQTKGELTAAQYLRLLGLLRTMDYSAESYVLTALRMVGLAKRSRWFPRKKKGAE